MPATPPIHPETLAAKQTENTVTNHPGSGAPFMIKYDKLVIAVGAYSQSERLPPIVTLITDVGLTLASMHLSVQRPWGEGACALLKGCQGRTVYKDACPGMYIITTIFSRKTRFDAYHSGFEQANQPIVNDIERRNLLHFCIVGACACAFLFLPGFILIVWHISFMKTRWRADWCRVCSRVA